MISINGKVDVHVDNPLKGIAQDIEDAARAVERGVKDAAQAVESAGRAVAEPFARLGEARAERAEKVLSAASRGDIVDAALDAIEAYTPGACVADGAYALGLARSHADRQLLQDIVNAALCGPAELSLEADVDVDVALEARLPGLELLQEQLDSLGKVPWQIPVRPADSHEVPRPATRLRGGLEIRGYAGAGAGGWVALGDPGQAMRGCLDRQVAALASGAGVLGFYWQASLPDIVDQLAAQPSPVQPADAATQLPVTMSGAASAAKAKPAAEKGQPPASPAAASASSATKAIAPKAAKATAASDKDLAAILGDTSLSFEDKLFLFMLAVAAKKQDEIDQMMEKFTAWEAHNAKEKKSAGDGTSAKSAGATEAKAASGGSDKIKASEDPLGAFAQQLVTGERAPGGSSGSILGGVVDLVKGLGPSALRLVGTAAPMAGPALGGVIGGALGTIALPVVGTGIGGALGTVAGNFIASVAVPALCDGVASGVESGDLDPLLKAGVLGGLSAAGPMGSLASAFLATEDGIRGLVQPETATAGLTQSVQAKSAAQTADSGATSKSAAAQEAATAASDETVPTSAKASSTKKKTSTLTEAELNRSEETWMALLQRAQQKLEQMYSLLSNMMKSFHDTQMTMIRNMA